MTNARDKANIPVLNFQSKGIDDNADATAITINSSEQVGIGTTSGDGLLNLSANSSGNNNMSITASDTSGGTDSKAWRVGFFDSDLRISTIADNYTGGERAYSINRSGTGITSHAFLVGGSEKARLTTTGLGIGTTSPGNKLHIHTSSSGEGILVKSTGNTYNEIITDANRTGSADTLGRFRGNWNTNPVAFISINTGDDTTNKDDGRIIFSTSSSGSSPTEKMRIQPNGSIGIGTSSPTTPLHIVTTDGGNVDESLTITNASTTSGTGSRIRFVSSTDISSTPNSVSISSYRNAGSNHDLLFESSNAEKMRITSAGEVGINTSSPQAKLHIVKTDVGALNDANSNTLMIENTNAGISIGSATTGEGHIYFSDSGDADVGAMSYFHSDNSLRFRANASERMRIDSSGNVGISTSSPSPDYGSDTVLEISGSTSPGLVINDTGQGSKYGIHADSNDLKIAYGSTALVSFQNDGKVGIGETAPLGKLHVKTADTGAGSVSGNANELVIENTGNVGITIQSENTGTGNLYFGDVANGSIGRVSYDHSSNFMSFNTNAGERMRINSSGLVMAGTTSPVNLGHTFKAIADSSLYFALSAEDHATGDAAIRGILSFASGNNGSSGTGYLYVGRTSDGDKFHVRSDGDVNNTNNSYGSISDRNLKENEVDASSQWNDIKAIQVKNYNLKSLPDKTHLGVIAQDLEASGMNGLVKTDEDGTKSVKYSILYMKSVKALQEAMTRIESLEAEVTALKNQP